MLKIISLRDRFKRTVKEDMIVYKVLLKSDDDSIAHSPFRSHPYVIGMEDCAILNSALLNKDIESGIHAFTSLSHALKCAEELRSESRKHKVCGKYGIVLSHWHIYDSYANKNWLTDAYDKETAFPYEIYKCIVPKGSKYYKGVWESKYPKELIPNIAADRLIVSKRITENAIHIQEAITTHSKQEPERLENDKYSVPMYSSNTTTTTYS